jgi:hypothetical protein
MVNVVIYLRKNHDSKRIVNLLLEHKLIASASIDEDNVLYKLEEGVIKEEVYTVVTSQSKALLFQEIVKLIELELGEETPIHSTPIVASNKVFDDSIRSKTLPI